MNHAMRQRIVEEVAARLRRRALSTATLSVAQLGEADIRSLLCQHASLRIVQVDLPLLEQLAGQRALAAAGCALHEAMAWGVRVQLTLLPALLPALAVKKLARLPLTFSDPLGQPVRLHAASVLTYADVARFSGGYLVLRRRPIITALAREAAVARHGQLIKQECTMLLARVAGAVVSTQKSPSLNGKKLLLVRRVSADDDRPILPTSGDEVAVDSVGAGVGELVLLCSGSSARHVFSGPNEAIDLAVVGIVDSLSR